MLLHVSGLALALLALQAPSQNVQELLARAVALHQSGDFEGAAKAYEEVLAVVDHPQIRSNLGAAYVQLGRLADAIEQYRKALEKDPTSVPIHLNLARALMKGAQIREAAAEAQRVVELDPGNAGAKVFLADCWTRLGESEKVVELLTPLAAAAPEDQAVSYLLGMALLRQNDVSSAQRVIDRILRDESPQALILMGFMEVRQGNCEAAIDHLRRSRELAPDLPTQHYLYGQCLMEQKDWQGAAQAFGDELALDPNQFEARLMLGTLQGEEGKNDEALVNLEYAARLRPDEPAVKLGLGTVYAAAGKLQEALPLLEEAARAYPTDENAHMQLAIVYFKLGRKEDAVRERETLRRLATEDQVQAAAGVSQAISKELSGETDSRQESGEERRR